MRNFAITPAMKPMIMVQMKPMCVPPRRNELPQRHSLRRSGAASSMFHEKSPPAGQC
jgi:hypothetical protein